MNLLKGPRFFGLIAGCLAGLLVSAEAEADLSRPPTLDIEGVIYFIDSWSTAHAICRGDIVPKNEPKEPELYCFARKTFAELLNEHGFCFDAKQYQWSCCPGAFQRECERAYKEQPSADIVFEGPPPLPVLKPK